MTQEPPKRPETPPAEPLRIVLVSPRNPLNIGAAARAMSNFGVRSLHLVNPYDRAFAEARSAVKSRYILEAAQIHNNLSDALAGCRLVVGTTASEGRDLHLPLYRLESAASQILQSAKPVALLFGSEKFGLSNDDLSYCQFLTRIPSRPEHGSMNLGQAIAICLYELHRNSQAESFAYPSPQTAAADDYHRFTEALSEILEGSGYINERTSESSKLKLRRLVQRLTLPESDARTWLGILRQVLWKVRGGGSRSDAILNRDDEGSSHL